jgi:BirA family biotin operon repressor/biotin-[acetyl-CoA-carboxylase] ligase
MPSAGARTPDEIRDALALAAPRLDGFLERFLWYDEIGSTNDAAAALAEHGVPEGAVVAADAQTAGRGRLGRVWASPRGAGLYVSIVLRPAAGAASLLTIATGVAVAEGIEAATGVAPALKWPNDVLMSGRKVAGILAEAGTAGAAVQHVIIGIGINVLPAAYPPDVASRATSLESEVGRPVDRGLVLAECLAAVAQRYRLLSAGGRAAIVDAWRRRAAPTLGRRVEWQAGGATQTGVARDVDDAGALLVETSSGLQRVVAGIVNWV